MKLIIAIVDNNDTDEALTQLNKSGFLATHIASTGTWLNTGSATLLVLSHTAQVKQVLDILHTNCGTRRHHSTNDFTYSGLVNTTESGGGAAFVIDLEQAVRL